MQPLNSQSASELFRCIRLNQEVEKLIAHQLLLD